jgi:iron complex outermembrane receptor protein
MSAPDPRRRPRAASAALLAALCGLAALSPLRGQAPDPDDPWLSPPLVLDPFEVHADDTGSDDHDPTGLDGAHATRTEPPFSNELLFDPAFDEIPLSEMESELGALAASRTNAAEVAAGSETVNLRGFPTPLRRNGFTQTGIPEVLNPERSELIIGSLVPVVGRAAPGGVRNFESARPPGRVTRQLNASLDTLGGWRTGARATGVVVPKKTWYLVSASTSGRDGPQRHAETRQSGLALALAVRHSRATSTLWNLDFAELRGRPAPGIPEYRRTPGGPIVGPYLPLAEFHTDGPTAFVLRQTASASLQIESQLGPDLSLGSGTQIFGRDSGQDRFTTGQFVESTGVFSGTRQPTHREEAHRGLAHQTDLTRRFQALGADHKLLGGIEFSTSVNNDENRGIRSADLATYLPPDVLTFDPDSPNYFRPEYSPEIYRRVITDRGTHIDSAAAVLSLRSAFNRGRTVLAAGVRRDQTHVEVRDRRVAPDAPAGIVPKSQKDLGNSSAHFGVNQRVGRRLLLFATASSAAQPSTRVDSRTGRIQDNATTAGIDFGFRAQALDRRLTFGAMAHAYTNSDIVRRNPLYNDPVADANQTQPQLVTSGEEEFRGLTAQLGWKPAPGWTLTARATWIDAYTVSSPDLPEEEGRPLAQLPAFIAATGARRSFTTGPLKGLSLGGTLTHVGRTVQSYERADRERLDHPAYTVANTDASYTWKAGRVTHTLSAAVNNLLDTDLLEKLARVGAERSLGVAWRVAF